MRCRDLQKIAISLQWLVVSMLAMVENVIFQEKVARHPIVTAIFYFVKDGLVPLKLDTASEARQVAGASVVFDTLCGYKHAPRCTRYIWNLGFHVRVLW